MRKHERELRKLARKYGRSVQEGKTHYKLICNSGTFRTVIASKSPSDIRSMKNLEQDLRRIHENREADE